MVLAMKIFEIIERTMAAETVATIIVEMIAQKTAVMTEPVAIVIVVVMKIDEIIRRTRAVMIELMDIARTFDVMATMVILVLIMIPMIGTLHDHPWVVVAEIITMDHKMARKTVKTK